MKILEAAYRRPFTGAWIETKNTGLFFLYLLCRPFTGAWIETCCRLRSSAEDLGRPFTGAWIETMDEYCYTFHLMSPLHGGVD